MGLRFQWGKEKKKNPKKKKKRSFGWIQMSGAEGNLLFYLCSVCTCRLSPGPMGRLAKSESVKEGGKVPLWWFKSPNLLRGHFTAQHLLLSDASRNYSPSKQEVKSKLTAGHKSFFTWHTFLMITQLIVIIESIPKEYAKWRTEVCKRP